jgi:uncharacterized protein DUF4129
MSAARVAIVLFAACCCCISGAAQTQVISVSQPKQFSLAEYISELDHLSALAAEATHRPDAADEAMASLRGGWKVSANGSTFDIPTDEIFDRFERLKKASDEKMRSSLLSRLALFKADAEAFQQPPPDSSSARATLAQILARSEFHNVHGPTWWDRLKYRVLMWIFNLLSRFFGSSAAPTVGKVFVWTLVGIAVLVLAYFMFRTLRRNARFESVIPQVTPVSAKSWRVWLNEAQAAAAQGLWRDAVHLAYWAGISFLEASGTWRPDKARTPREYLRLLASGSEHRASLSALTRSLELTWYGNQPAGPETFSETVTHLEELGCRQV